MIKPPPCVRVSGSGVELALHVQPRARRSEVAGLHNGALKVKISAPPVDDAANRAVVEFFAELFGLPKSRLRIVSGLKSREKVLRIESVSLDAVSSFLPALSAPKINTVPDN